jgi:CIC family chloride channel protein
MEHVPRRTRPATPPSTPAPLARRRVPAPLVRHRLPSGRGAMEQPNATGDGDAALNVRFWIALVVTGVATGLLGDVLMVVLFGTQHIAFLFHTGSFTPAVARVSPERRMLALLVAGGFGGVAWYLLRKYTPGQGSQVDDAIWVGDGHVAFPRSLGTSLISEVVVGLGASLGREAAPKLMGGASGSLLSDRLGLSLAQRKLVVACGAGAGLAAVYNVPLGGALFTAEILLGAITLPVVLPALACTVIATTVSWLYLPTHAAYTGLPTYHFSASLLVWGLIVGPIIGLLAAGYIRAIGWISHHQVRGRAALVAPLVAFALLGVAGWRYPQLLGNGKGMAFIAFVGQGGALLFLALVVLKPLVTTLCLGSGAQGGLFTPFMSTGAVFGALVGIGWNHVWPGSPVGAFALIGAAAMSGASLQGPLTGVVLVLELTHTGFQLAVPAMAATMVATAVARAVDGYSIYSARLPAA